MERFVRSGKNICAVACFKGELKSIQSMENLVSGLVDCGWDYNKVKAFIENTNTKHLQIA